MGQQILGIHDVLVSSLMLVIFYVYAYSVKSKNEVANPEYKYFVKGLSLKFGAGIFFCLIYTLLYDGGDTTAYYNGAVTMVNLATKNLDSYLFVLQNKGQEYQRWILFDSNTGFPPHYMFKDPKTFSVIRFTSVLMFLSFKSYIGVTLLLSFVCYFGIFRFYKLMVELYPKLSKELAIGILFIPSAIFWGSGLLKDTYTFAALCWFVSSFYYVFIKKEKIISNIIYLLFAAYLIINLKAYILNAILPGALLWATFDKIKSFENQIIKFVVAPFLILAITYGGFTLLLKFSDSFGQFSIENSLNEALVIQQDLKRDVYGANSFDLGEIDPSVSGILSKAHLAIEAGLFRPYIWEARNPLMIMSGLENLFLLGLTIVVVIRLGLFKIIGIIRNEPFVSFALIFSLFFAFSIGFSTPNFGALIRYKIPLIPFFVPMLYILKSHIKQDKYVKVKKKK